MLRKEDELEWKKQQEDDERVREEERSGGLSAQRAPSHNKKKNTTKPRQRAKVEGKIRLELHSKWIDRQLKETPEDGISYLEGQEEGIMEDIMAEMCRDHKSSHLANEETLQRYNQAANKQRNRRVVSKHLVDITPWVEGSVILSYLYEKDGARPYVLAEIKKRRIKYNTTKPFDEMNKKEKERHKKKWEGCSIKQMTAALKVHEHARLAREEGQHLKDFKEVKNIKPLSQKLQQWMPKQWAIYKRKKGQVHEGAEDA